MGYELLFSFIGASFFGIIPILIYLLPILVKQKLYINDKKVIEKINFTVIVYPLIMFVISFLVLLIVFFNGYTERTITGVFKLLWIPGISILIISALYLVICYDSDSDFERDENSNVNSMVVIMSCISIVLSIFIAILGTFSPIQSFVQKWNNPIELEQSMKTKIDMEEISNIAGTAYYARAREIRKVNGEFIIVIKLSTNYNVIDIPGYIIQNGDEKSLVSSKCIFDVSLKDNKEAKRIARKEFPTVVITNSIFDIGDDNVQYELFLYREKKFSTNKENDYGIIAVNLSTGEAKKYKNSEIPNEFDFTVMITR